MSQKEKVFVMIKTKFELPNEKHTWQAVISVIEQGKYNKEQHLIKQSHILNKKYNVILVNILHSSNTVDHKKYCFKKLFFRNEYRWCDWYIQRSFVIHYSKNVIENGVGGV